MIDTTADSTSHDPRCGQAYLLLAFSWLLLIVIGAAVQAYSVPLGLAVTELLLILLPAVMFVRQKGLGLISGMRWRTMSPRKIVLSAMIGVAGWGMAVIVHGWIVRLLGPDPAMGIGSAQTAQELAVLLFVGALLPGVCEEALFRGVIQGVLERRGATFAVLVTGILFGLYHMSPWTIVPAALLGIVYGIMVVRTGSVVSSTIAHVCNNATAFVAGFTLTEESIVPFSESLAAAFVVLGGLFLYVTSNASPARSPLATVPANLSRRWRKSVWILGILGMVVVATGFIFFTTVKLRTIETDLLSPNMDRGDIAIVALDKSFARPLRSGDTVLWVDEQDQRREKISRVARAEDTQVWIELEDGEREIPRDFVLGKVIRAIKSRAVKAAQNK